MSNTVITNYTDLNGPSTKADSSVVVIVNKDGSLSVDQKLLGTLMGTDGSQSAGISVVRVGHEGKPDDATDSETDDEKVPHVTLSVDSYYDEPNSIIKYDSGAEMLQSLRIETRENSLLGFQNDHCYTPLKSPTRSMPENSDNVSTYDESIIEITHTPPPKPVPSAKKITILEQQIISKGKKLLIKPSESPILIKANDVLNKPLQPLVKSKESKQIEKSIEALQKSDESSESSSISSSGDSIPDRDSDSDYKDTKDRSGSLRLKKPKLKPRILKSAPSKASKLEPKVITKLKTARTIIRREIKEKAIQKNVPEKKDGEVDLESLLPLSKISTTPIPPNNDLSKVVSKQTPKAVKKEKKTPAHVTALLSDMTSLFTSPDVIRRVSTDAKVPPKTPTSEKEMMLDVKKPIIIKMPEINDVKPTDTKIEVEKPKTGPLKTYVKPKEKVIQVEKAVKAFDVIPQLDDASLAQILQDTTSIPTHPVKSQPTISTASMNSPSLAGPLSPTLDLLGGLQPEEEGLTEDFLMSVAQLVASSENLQEVIDKQVLGKVDTVPAKTIQTPPAVQPQQIVQTPQQQTPTSSLYLQTPTKTAQKSILPRKDPIEIVRRDGRVITLPPIEAPATRSSKRKSQMETAAVTIAEPVQPAPPRPPSPAPVPVCTTPEPTIMAVSKQYINKKLTNKKQEPVAPPLDKMSVESLESWNSEDDPYRLWCICKQPHNNRFMICCDGCEDWFHGKCVNITKAMGQQMEEQGIEWRCPNCIKKAKPQLKNMSRAAQMLHKLDSPVIEPKATEMKSPPSAAAKDLKTSCIVCKKPARLSSIYCSNNCIWKHAQDSLGNQTPGKGDETGKSSEKQKAESRVIVYERKTGRLLAGPNAPTAENLKAWLQSNPTFEVVRPGTLNTIKPNIVKKKTMDTNKIQTTLNFERIPRKSAEQSVKSPQTEVKERSIKLIPTPKLVEAKATPPMKSPATPKSQQMLLMDTPKASTSAARSTPEPRKIMRSATNRSQSSHEKAPSVSPSTSRRKDSEYKPRMASGEPIRDNVRKALQEQMSIRMAENKGAKFSEEAIQRFANDTELELHELFRDVGMKYKAKYRSLMFNIKDRKNLTLWEKICDRSITPKQLVRLSPEELASQELAQWRDKEAKYQLELIKKSELDLLAASKTYVLKTHKGEEVMETKESVSTELDPNVPIEDVVTALNDSTVGPEVLKEKTPEIIVKVEPEKKHSKKRNREDSSSGHSKKSKKDSKRESARKSRSSRRSDSKEKESREDQRKSMRRSEKKSSRARSPSKDRSKVETKEKSDSEKSRHRSSSREKSRRLSKSRTASRSKSQERERSRSRTRSRRSQSRDSAKRRNRSRSKRRSSEEKLKLRSRSQDNAYIKSKHDSTDSDSIERPKSAMLKEAHPAYDPHEPMITSAFSEEDLRKSREDVFEENYRNEMSSFEAVYDPSKLVDSNILLPETSYTPPIKQAPLQNKASEVESDQEPSSTVETSSATVWSGCINMVDVARFYVAAHEVSGSATDLEDDLSTELDIVGRINPDTVWDYITKMKKTSNKDIVILRLQTANDEEKMQYIALYSYLSSRNRLGVVKVTNMTTVKDFYVVPVPANTTLPAVLLPLDGPGIGEIKTHLLIAIVIRQRKKRSATNIPTEIIPAKMSRKRSYTPPASPRRRPLPLPAYASTSLSTTVKDKIAASLVSADDDEPYSPGSSTSSSTSAPLASNTLRTKMEELNRQIEEQKQQILKMAQADSSVGGEDEAYSPSRPMTPPAVQSVPLADIALPSNLQEILATIKQRSESAADVDMRKLPLP